MKITLTYFYTALLLNESRKNGKCKTMKALKLKTKLQDLNK